MKAFATAVLIAAPLPALAAPFTDHLRCPMHPTEPICMGISFRRDKASTDACLVEYMQYMYKVREFSDCLGNAAAKSLETANMRTMEIICIAQTGKQCVPDYAAMQKLNNR